MKLSDLVGKDNNTLLTLIINGEKGPLMTQRTLALSGLRLQGGPMIPSKGGVFRRQSHRCICIEKNVICRLYLAMFYDSESLEII